MATGSADLKTSSGEDHTPSVLRFLPAPYGTLRTKDSAPPIERTVAWFQRGYIQEIYDTRNAKIKTKPRVK